MSSRRTNIKILTVGSGIIHHYYLLYTFIHQILYNEHTLPKMNSNCYIKKKLVYIEPKSIEQNFKMFSRNI